MALNIATAQRSTFYTIYDSSNRSHCGAAIQMRDGGYALLGEAWQGSTTAPIAYLRRTDPNGISTWKRFIGSPSDDNEVSFRLDAKNSIVLTGINSSTGHPWLFTVDSAGLTTDSAVVDVVPPQGYTTFCYIPDSEFVFVKLRQPTPDDSAFILLSAYSKSGDSLWSSTIPLPYSGSPSTGSKQVTLDKIIFVPGVGFTAVGTLLPLYAYAPSQEIFIVRIKPDAQFGWATSYYAPWTAETSESIVDIKPTSDSGAIILSESRDFNYPSKIHLARFDARSNLLLNTTFFAPPSAQEDWHPLRTVTTLEGGYAVTFTRSPKFGLARTGGFLLVTDDRGSVISDTSFLGDSRTYYGNCIIATPDSGYSIAGTTVDSVTRNENSFLLRTNSSGTVSAVFFPHEGTSPTSLTIVGSFPNPFNPSTTICFDTDRSQHATIRVFNLLGQQIATLFDNDLPRGSHKILWDATNFSSGVYLCSIRSGGSTKTLKLIIIR